MQDTNDPNIEELIKKRLKELAGKGGKTTVSKYGKDYMKQLALKSAKKRRSLKRKGTKPQDADPKNLL